MRWIASLAAVLCCLCVAGIAAEENRPTTDIPEANLQEASLGTYWYGAPIDLRDLVGQVVLWETWGS
jgi:hypothetical protein